MLDAQSPTRRITLGGDMNYAMHQFVQALRARPGTLPVAQHTTNWTSAIDGWHPLRHPGSTVRQQKRHRVEAIVGWLKTGGVLRNINLRGQRVGGLVTFAAAVDNLVRIRHLMEAAP